MTIQRGNQEGGGKPVVRLVIIGAVIGGLIALLYSLFKRSNQQPPRQ